MQNHYNYTFDSITNTYNFTTKNSILYRVAFIVDETFSTISEREIANVFQLVIEKPRTRQSRTMQEFQRPSKILLNDFFQKLKTPLPMFVLRTMRKPGSGIMSLTGGTKNLNSKKR